MRIYFDNSEGRKAGLVMLKDDLVEMRFEETTDHLVVYQTGKYSHIELDVSIVKKIATFWMEYGFKKHPVVSQKVVPFVLQPRKTSTSPQASPSSEEGRPMVRTADVPCQDS